MTAVLDTPETTTTKPASLAQIHRYFLGDADPKSYTLAKFRSDWSELTDGDKTQLREGIGNGSFTY